MTQPLTLSTKSLFEINNYTFLGKSTKKRYYNYICPAGHRHSMRKDHWLRGIRCPECAGNHKLTFSKVNSSLLSEGYILLETKYINSSTVMRTLCPAGHNYNISWNNWSQGYRCSKCSGRTKKSISEIASEVNKEGYRLLSTEYVDCKTPIELVCENNHRYQVSWDNWNSKGSRCPKCNNVGESIQEKELFSFVNKIAPNSIRHNRIIVAPFELDIVIPDKKVAIEYCGLYWHSELLGKSKTYHKNKLDLCVKKGYRLVTIFEDEWVHKRHITEARLKDILGVCEKTIHAKSCSIREIDNKLSSLFCSSNNLFGSTSNDLINLGAFYKDELVGVMVFSKVKKHKPTAGLVLELCRFCCKTGHTIPGLFKKMLAFFNKAYPHKKVFSYADLRWSDGKVYEKSGFKRVGFTQPNCWYFKNSDNSVRLPGSALKKTKDFPKGVKSWNRIWDCGNIKYMLEKATVN